MPTANDVVFACYLFAIVVD